MKYFTISIVTIMVLLCVVLASSCGPPEVDLVADYILVGFKDGSSIELTPGAPEYEEISKEAICIYQYVGLATECYFGTDEIEAVKNSVNFVEIGFDKAEDVPTSTHINDLEEEIRDKHGREITEEGYLISELKSALFPFDGDYDGHVLYQRGNLDTAWYCFKGGRSFGKLERLANKFR